LFAAPVLALCAGAGIERLVGGRHRWAGVGLLAAFLAVAAGSDYRVATRAKDGFGAQAQVLATRVPGNACVAVAPPNQDTYYLFLRPELQSRICEEPAVAPHAIAVMSPYSTAGDRAQLRQSLDRNYDEAGVLQSGAGSIVDYRRR
jgi:hypothetical protein